MEKDDFGFDPIAEAERASLLFGVEVESVTPVDTPGIEAEQLKQLRKLLAARGAIYKQIRDITGLTDNDAAVSAAQIAIQNDNMRPVIIEPATPRPYIPDDRDPSVSIHTASAGLPTHGKRR